MFTTCPNCTLTLALTANDLRVGQGHVRCGRCGRVFNALISLTEEQALENAAGGSASGTISQPLLTDLEPPPEPSTPDPDAFPMYETPPDGVKVLENRSTGTFETIVLEGDSYTQIEEQVDQAEVDQQLQQIARRMDADELAHVREALEDEPELSLVEDDGEFQDGEVENVVMETPEVDPQMDADIMVGNRRRAHWAWTAAATAAAVLLAGQMVHHSRQSLVTRAWAQPALSATYSMFGVTLEPNWDLAAYDLRQLGGESTPDAANRIVVRATVHNRAEHVQPVPMIRVVLQDRFGNALSTHDIGPQDYMNGPVPSRLKPDQRVDAELNPEDPNRQAVGFELDACLPDATRQLHCSNDL
jgi:predicted Zn finger-like uncharacterized protein